MLTAEQIDAITFSALRSFHEMEAALLAEGAAKVSAGASSAEVNRAIEAVGSAQRAKCARAVEKALRTAARQSLLGQEELYNAARVAGLVASYVPISQSATISPLLAQGLASATSMSNLVGIRAVQASSALVIDALDSAALAVLTGSMSSDAAVAQAVATIAKEHATIMYVSEAGRVVNSSVYGAARRAVVTSVNQTTGRMMEARMREVGAEHVQVSAHMGARPDHAVWQGQVYRFDELAEKTGYGTGAGLEGWNCRHSFGPFFPGIMEETDYSWVNDDRNKEIYELSQRQRQAERNIREYDRRVRVLEAGGGESSRERFLRSKWEREAQRVANLQEGKRRFARESATGSPSSLWRYFAER